MLSMGANIDFTRADQQLKNKKAEIAKDKIKLKSVLEASEVIKNFNEIKGNIEKQRITITPVIDTKGFSETNNALNELQNHTNKLAENLTTFNKWAKAEQVVRTETNKWVDAQKALHTIITKTTSEGNVYQTRLKQTANELGAVTTTTQNYIRVAGQLQKAGEAFTTVEQGTSKANSALKEINKTEIEATKNAEKLAKAQKENADALIKSYQARYQNAQRLIEQNKKLEKEQADLIQKAKSIETWNNKVSHSFLGLGNSITDAIGKVMLFKVATTITMSFYGAITEAKDAILEYNKAATEFKKISDLDGEALDRYAVKLGKLGESVARTRSEMLTSSAQFRKSGYSDEDSAKLARTAELNIKGS